METKLEFIQKEMLRIANYFHQFCIENKLNYAICGGTLLGAVRHHSFIPWDDDFDVIMPRNDFEKFLQIWHNTENIEIIKNGDNNYYKFATPAKLHNPNTRVIELGEIENGIPQKFISNGVFIDIFPLDIYPDNLMGKFLNNYIGKINIKKSLSRFPMTTLSFKHRLFIKLFNFVPQFLVNWLVNTSINYLKNNKQGKVGYGVESAITNLWLDKNAIYPFKLENCIAGNDFFMPANADMYLSHRFQDYMSVPEPDKRVSHICQLYIQGKLYLEKRQG
jgi:lipopolysaccharide cholinephosphotransferase